MEAKAVAERNETWNLCEGLGRIRWGDDFTTIGRLYPQAYEKRRRFGRNPRTGEVIEVVPGLGAPRFLAASDELFMDASVEFSLDWVVEEQRWEVWALSFLMPRTRPPRGDAKVIHTTLCRKAVLGGSRR